MFFRFQSLSWWRERYQRPFQGRHHNPPIMDIDKIVEGFGKIVEIFQEALEFSGGCGEA